jgi:hypothetical protein
MSLPISVDSQRTETENWEVFESTGKWLATQHGDVAFSGEKGNENLAKTTKDLFARKTQKGDDSTSPMLSAAGSTVKTGEVRVEKSRGSEIDPAEIASALKYVQCSMNPILDRDSTVAVAKFLNGKGGEHLSIKGLGIAGIGGEGARLTGAGGAVAATASGAPGAAGAENAGVPEIIYHDLQVSFIIGPDGNSEMKVSFTGSVNAAAQADEQLNELVGLFGGTVSQKNGRRILTIDGKKIGLPVENAFTQGIRFKVIEPANDVVLGRPCAHGIATFLGISEDPGKSISAGQISFLKKIEDYGAYAKIFDGTAANEQKRLEARQAEYRTAFSQVELRELILFLTFFKDNPNADPSRAIDDINLQTKRRDLRDENAELRASIEALEVQREAIRRERVRLEATLPKRDKPDMGDANRVLTTRESKLKPENRK